MIQTIQLTPGVVLRHYPDKRFKTAVLSVQFQRPLCREEAALNALLSSVLLRGTEKNPDMRAITARMKLCWRILPRFIIRTKKSCGRVCC